MIPVPEKAHITRIRLDGFYWILYKGERAIPAVCTMTDDRHFEFTFLSVAYSENTRTALRVEIGREIDFAILAMNEPVIESDDE